MKMINKSQERALVNFNVLYANAVKKNKKNLMQKAIGMNYLDALITFAKNEKIEISGGLDFEANRHGVTGIKHLHGTHWSSPFFQEDDFEMQFHTHVAYRRDKNTASCHPSPADMANVNIFYPGIILWENKAKEIQITILLSANKFFVSSDIMEVAYEKAQNQSRSNTSIIFMNSWRATLNRSGMDFHVISPQTRFYVSNDITIEENQGKKVKIEKSTKKKGDLETISSRYKLKKQYWCDKHQAWHKHGTITYQKCAMRIGVDVDSWVRNLVDLKDKRS